MDKNLRRVHMGCGLTYLEGWINCDGSPSLRLSRLPKPLKALLKASGIISGDVARFLDFLETHPVRYVNALKPWPFPRESVDVIYTSHVIDCFSAAQKHHFFRECFRVLRPGGVIRMVGIDLAQEVQLYCQDHDAAKLVSIVSYPNPNDTAIWRRLKDAIWPPKYYLAHLDFPAYNHLLRSIGFHNIVCLPPGETTIKTIEPVNLYQRRGESMYVEAYKPGEPTAHDPRD